MFPGRVPEPEKEIMCADWSYRVKHEGEPEGWMMREFKCGVARSPGYSIDLLEEQIFIWISPCTKVAP